MKFSDSPVIHFLRGITLLATLVLVPGIAIFWNHLPENLVHKSEPKPVVPKTEKSLSDSLSVPETIVEPDIPAPKYSSYVAVQQVSWEQPPTELPMGFDALKQYLDALGAKYYCLEKWGASGDLFRFSCLVAPSESSSYEKHFQAIGTDAMGVMQKVIGEIEQWRNTLAAR